MNMMEKRNFYEFMSELIVLGNEVVSCTKNPEIEMDAFTEFAILVEKLLPILNDLRDRGTIMGKPAIRRSLECLEYELGRAKALFKSPYLKDPIKQIERITHDLGRSLSLLLVASLEVSTDFRERIGILQKQLMNARFGGNTSLSSSPISKFVSDVKVEGEIEEEIINVTLDDVILQLKNGNAEEFAVALLRLKKFIRDGELDSGLINEEAIVFILLNRLGSCKADNRLAIIPLLRSIALKNDETRVKNPANKVTFLVHVGLKNHYTSGC